MSLSEQNNSDERIPELNHDALWSDDHKHKGSKGGGGEPA